MVKELKKISVEAFDKHCVSGVYTLQYDSLDHIIENIRRFRTLSDFESSLYDHFNVPIKQAYKNTS